jgi:hypothetical protein
MVAVAKGIAVRVKPSVEGAVMVAANLVAEVGAGKSASISGSLARQATSIERQINIR